MEFLYINSQESSFGSVELKPLKGITIDNKIDINFGMEISEVKNIPDLKNIIASDMPDYYDVELSFNDENKLTAIYFEGSFCEEISIYGYIIERLEDELITELSSFLKGKGEIHGSPNGRWEYNYYFSDIDILLYTYLRGPPDEDADEEVFRFLEENEGSIITGLSIYGG
jgi:hypothetical protein